MKGRIACVVRYSKDGNSQTNYIGRIQKLRRFRSIVNLKNITVENRTAIVTYPCTCSNKMTLHEM